MNIKLPCEPKKIYDWKIEEHKVLKSFDPKRMSLWLSEEQKTGYIRGNKLKEELPNNVLNACVLDYLLEHTELIPEEWKGKYVFFWGTIYRSSDGRLCVRCLCWLGGRWDWPFPWLVDDFDGSHPAALSASPLSFKPDALALKTLELRVKELEEFVDKLKNL